MKDNSEVFLAKAAVSAHAIKALVSSWLPEAESPEPHIKTRAKLELYDKTEIKEMSAQEKKMKSIILGKRKKQEERAEKKDLKESKKTRIEYSDPFKKYLKRTSST